MKLTFQFVLSAFFLLIVVPARASADGALSFSLDYNSGFMIGQLEKPEPNVISGWINYGMAQNPAATVITGNQLTIYAMDREFPLTLTQDKGSTYYIGKWETYSVSMLASRDKKRRLHISGRIADMQFQFSSDPVKRTLDLYWDRLALVAHGKKNAPGVCEGDFYVESDKVGRFSCESSGDLTDAFFDDPTAIIGFLVHRLVVPKSRLSLSSIR